MVRKDPDPVTSITPAVLSARDAGRYIGRSRRTVYRLVELGELRPFSDGLEGMRFRVADIDAWLTRRADGGSNGR